MKCTQKALEYKGHEAEFDAYSRTLKRYILAFHALIYKDVRDIGDLSDLAQRRLLSGAEVRMLEAARGPRSVVVSGWMYRLVTKMEQTDVLFCEVKVIQVQLTGRLYEIRRHTTNLFAHVNKQYVSPPPIPPIAAGPRRRRRACALTIAPGPRRAIRRAGCRTRSCTSSRW